MGSPLPPPEKAPPLLAESKATAAALASLEQGIKLLFQKEYRRARVELQSLIDGYPLEAEIIARARSYLHICEREEASRKKAPVPHDQLYTLGVMEHNRTNYGGAIELFRQALQKNPQADHIHYALAASRAQMQDGQGALESLGRAIELNEQNRIYAKNDPDFAHLHTLEGFINLVGINPASLAQPEPS